MKFIKLQQAISRTEHVDVAVRYEDIKSATRLIRPESDYVVDLGNWVMPITECCFHRLVGDITKE